MAVRKIIKEYKDGYVTIDLNSVKDTRLWGKDLGNLIRILALNEGWNFSASGLARIYPESPSTFTASFRRLEKLGYLVMEEQSRNQGRYGEGNVTVIEQPEGRIIPKGKKQSKQSDNQTVEENNRVENISKR
ncbi:MAG: hypothetical protein LUF92_11240 [Clostridiales bacterium]|nr:hypothetical protein [Clostridiales bacterium]